MRTKEPIILGSNTNNNPTTTSSSPTGNTFSQHASLHRIDQQQRARSVLCFPVTRHDECRAVLYLENEQVDDAFSHKHAQIMGILANQINMTLENAKLSALLQSEKKYHTTAVHLEQAKKRLEEFIDILCHELRNPLNCICGNNDMMNDVIGRGTLGDTHHMMSDMEESLKSIATAGEQLKDIIDNVLTASMLENNSVRLHKVSMDPVKILDAVMDMFMDKAKERNIHMTKVVVTASSHHDTTSSSGTTKVMCDPRRLTEVLINFVSNACKYMDKEQGGQIVCKFEEQRMNDHKTNITFSVQDNGCGMSDKDIARIMCHQPSDSTFRLGMRISRELVELMGGTLSIESKLNEGSTFSCSFCLDDSSSMSSSHTPEDSSDANSENMMDDESGESTCQRALVVDDNLINQKILCRLLRTRGFVCDVASNGLEALQLIASSHFDVVLMDVDMPVMDGLEATKRVRLMEMERCTKHVLPIIGVSGRAKGDEPPGADCGMQGYVCKPYMANEIIAAIHAAMAINEHRSNIVNIVE